MKKKMVTLLLGLSLTFPLAAKADVNDPLLRKLVEKGTLTKEEAEEIQTKNLLTGLKIGGVAYIDYSFGHTGDEKEISYNRFTLQRAYINKWLLS